MTDPDLTFDLLGTDTAHCDGRVFRSRRAPICEAARALIREGFDGHMTVRVMRDGAPVFRADHMLGEWAATGCTEGDTQVRLTTWTARPDFQSEAAE